MKRPSSFAVCAACLAAGAVPVVLAHALPAARLDAVASVPAPSAQVADALDSIIQPRFQDLSAGKFGMGRIVPPVSGHAAVGYVGAFAANTPAEAGRLARADSAGRPYMIGLLHCAPVPGYPSASAAPAAGSGFSLSSADADFFAPHLTWITAKGIPKTFLPDTCIPVDPQVQDAAVKALPAAQKGNAVQTPAGPWTLFLRPVRATQSACLTCHTTATWGDTLGVMVYAVGRTQTANPARH